MEVNFIDSNTFAPFTVNPESVSVVDGSICIEFTSEDNAAFFQFSLEHPPTLTPGAGMWGCQILNRQPRDEVVRVSDNSSTNHPKSSITGSAVPSGVT